MTEEKGQKNTSTQTSTPKASQGGGAPRDAQRNKSGFGGAQRPKNKRRRTSRRPDRPRSEFDQTIISIRRVTRVVAGGRRFSFSVSMVLGNRKGQVGVGIGKASDTALAIEKSIRDAKKNMIKVTLTKEMRIPHETRAKYCASEVVMKPSPGKGLVAGSSVRNVLELAGIKDVASKILSRSKNRLNNAQAAIKALRALQ